MKMNPEERKSLRRPDQFAVWATETINSVAGNRKLVIGVGVAVLIFAGASLMMSSISETKERAGRDALFIAQQTLETEFKAKEDAERKRLFPEKPQVPQVKDEKKNAKGDQTKKDMAAEAYSLQFQKLDVETMFPKAVEELKKVDNSYAKTRAGREAAHTLGSLFYDHGQPEKALPWFEKSLAASKRPLEKTLALSAIAYTLEDLGRFDDAREKFSKALEQGELAVRGDLLLGLARTQRKTGMTAEATATYEKILQELPGTTYAKKAESYKNAL